MTLKCLVGVSQPDESNRKMNLAVASKIIDGVKNDERRSILATHYTPLSTRETAGTSLGKTWTRDALVKTAVRHTIMYHHSQPKQGMKAIGLSLEVENASEKDHEGFMRGVIAKIGPKFFFVATLRVSLSQIAHNFGMLWAL